MNIFAKGKKQIILRREDLVKNTRLPSKELSKLFFGNTHFFEHYQNVPFVLRWNNGYFSYLIWHCLGKK